MQANKDNGYVKAVRWGDSIQMKALFLYLIGKAGIGHPFCCMPLPV